MHEHFADTFNATEFGVRIEHRNADPVSGTLLPGQTVRQAQRQDDLAAERQLAEKAKEQPKLTPNEADRSYRGTAAEQSRDALKEIIKDGKISKDEKAAVLGGKKATSAVKKEQDRLEEKIGKARDDVDGTKDSAYTTARKALK
ncbi:MAG: hypothetical protein JWO69_452, partial [Thermoleophilia bacterium]|nr:hypothetical protein [Thermoleophilia bacterium]